MDNLIQRKNNAGISQTTEEVKEIAEIQAKMLLARNFPRDVDFCLDMIKHECHNRSLAESAIYEFPRGDSVVRGASIRLVECVARHWGNIISGVKELGTVGNRATVKAYCWDLESNFFDEKIFEVEYVRSTRKGSYEITDARDRYEMMANMGARRKRACMQAVIPQFVIDEAMEECKETLEKDISAQNLEETKEKMISKFVAIADWITPEHLSAVCGKDFEHISAKDIVKLRNLYNAIKDGFVKPEKVFGRETEPEKPSIEESNSLETLNNMLAGDKNESEQ
ncbi:MAG: hypothetical protein ACI4QZ_07275 [Eubacteriales bacterium]